MNLGKVEIWETSLDRIVTLREGAKGVLRPWFRSNHELALTDPSETGKSPGQSPFSRRSGRGQARTARSPPGP